MPKETIKDKIIVALDMPDFGRAKKLVKLLYPKIKIFKVGSQLFTMRGPDAVQMVKDVGAEVFLDLKFFDIPNTVANAVKEAVKLDVFMLTLHITGGDAMLKAAVEARNSEAELLNKRRPLLVGVTVLTSQSVSAQHVLRLAKIGLGCGLDGIVCSAREAASLRKEIKRDFLIVTPGIRLEDSKRDDQKRVATIEEAIKAGSDYLVIGRPIVEARFPLNVIKDL